MSRNRLTALDASFLEVESPTAHMHVGWASLFASPDGKPAPTFEELRDHIGARLSRAPRYRQKLAEVPLGLNDPVWVDDPMPMPCSTRSSTRQGRFSTRSLTGQRARGRSTLSFRTSPARRCRCT
jgi:hypothetical protein